jgi:hypothetical protein
VFGEEVMRISIVGLVIVLFGTTTSFGKTIHVPSDSSTIQGGINGAVDGDTVLVADGIYTGLGNKNVDFKGKAITVRSENGPDTTVIDCGGEGRGFFFHRGEDEDSRVCGFTIRHGLVSSGGGICCANSSPVITNCIICDNEATALTPGTPQGGGIWCDAYSSPVISNCVIRNNITRVIPPFHGWGLGGGIFSRSAFLLNCIIWHNQGDEIYVDGAIAPSVIYSNIDGGYAGEGNIDEEPLFRDPDNGNYHLMATYCGDPYDSPCIDAGDPLIFDEIMGCQHGLGTPRWSDMGAYGGSNSSWPTAVEEEEKEISTVPKGFVLFQDYPNPFNATAKIRYQIPEEGHVTLKIFNTLGQEVRHLVDGHQMAGVHIVSWDGQDDQGREVTSGIYFCQLRAGDFSEIIKMVLVR